MKKLIFHLLVVLTLVVGTLVLSGCGNNEEVNNLDKTSVDVVENTDINTEDEGLDNGTVVVSSESMTMIHDSELNNKIYNITFESNSEDNEMTTNTQYPDYAQITNENGNYMFSIQIDELSQAEYDITMENEKNNSDWKEEKFGEFTAYTSTDPIGTKTIRVIIDESNPEGRVYATMLLDFYDSSNTNGMTIEELYKSSKVQFIINSIKCIATSK
ncbi:MAG: hypothetical protein IKR04_07375 [Clostridia bacterium]|nr:hypothetical protein [Clostridia bacterium]